MARFSIYHSDGTEVCKCIPVYHGTYLQPAYLEIRSLAETDAINLRIGDYITWRDGRTYTLYSLPNVTQNTATVIGDKLTYDSLQFFDDCKQLDIALWRDLVENDNTIHFSTQKDIATYESLDGIRRRIQSCLDAIYPGRWSVKVADGLSDPSSGYYREDISEPKEFSLEAGSSVLDALNLIYDTWTLIGWTYSVVDGVNVITIGGANVKESVIPDYEIGKGKGITKIKATLSNSADIATRIYPFGSSTNVPVRHYNNKNIYNAASVDIQNVMIPVSYWGTTQGLPDASKAYLEDTDASAVLGVRPKVIYMDGDDYGDIYPSIEGVTIGNIRLAKLASGDLEYMPDSDIYEDSERADELKAVSGSTDNGYKTSSDSSVAATAYPQTIDSPSKETTDDYYIGSQSNPLYSCTLAVGTYPSYSFASDGLVTFAFAPHTTAVSQTATVYQVALMVSDGTAVEEVALYDDEFQISSAETLSINTNVAKNQFLFNGKENTTVNLVMWLKVSYYKPNGTFTATTLSDLTVSAKNNIRTTQTGISLKQIGFDISDYKAKGNSYGYIAFKSGMCSGRSFKIASCDYDSATDSWTISIKRTYDKDLKQYFPNTFYQLSAGDRFVLTDILMPDIYVDTAEQRLYERAQEVLAELCKPIFVLEPSLDSKFVEERGALLLFKPGVYFDFDTDIFIDEYYSSLIDTVTVTESDYAIPTVSITLREKKRKSFKTESSSSSSSSSSSDSDDDTVSEDTTASSSTSITIDNILSDTSTNPVQNAVVTDAIKSVRSSIPTKTSQLTNDSGFLTSHQSLTDYAKKSDIPTKTSQLTNDSGFLTSHQSLDGYAKTTDLKSKQDVLVSGTNIKTINGESVLGSGDITIEAEGIDTAQLVKATPILTIRKFSNAELVQVSHPCIGVADCEIVLMRYAKRNTHFHTSTNDRPEKKGWCAAQGYRNGNVLAHGYLTSTGNGFSLTELRNYIVKHFMRWTGKTLDALLASDYSTWSASSDTDRGFGNRKNGHARFGIAVRYLNPAFVALLDSSKSLSLDTTEIGNVSRYIYSPVAPLDVILRSTEGTHDRRYIEFGLTGTTPVCDIASVVDSINGEAV